MSEERSWAEDTVVLGSRDRGEEAEPERVAPTRRPRSRRIGLRKAPALIVGLGTVMITIAVAALAGGGDGRDSLQATTRPDRIVPVEREQQAPQIAGGGRPQVGRQVGPLEIAEGRRAPKPARSKTEPAQAPASVEEEPAPVYEPAPEPVVEPEPEPSAAPAPETPAAVEFGM